jgi:hypothetical protein
MRALLSPSECPGAEPGNCFVFRGLMDLYLVREADKDVAFLEARKAIRNLMSETNGLVVTGIENVNYLRPALSDTDGLEGSQSIAATERNEQLGSGLVTLAALGSFFVLVAMIAAYRYNRTGDRDDSKLTIDPNGSQITGASSNLSRGPSPLSPFSAMLPNAYRLNEPDSMSAILEGDSDSSIDRSHDIVVSDSGYTEEDSRDVSYMQGFTNDPVLGAHKMDEYDAEEDYLFDTGDEALQTVIKSPEKDESSAGEKEGSIKEGSMPESDFSA